ncbi:MAG: TIGR03759 family integrating conjugative element protein [Gammaproteobacteria bacterium]|nr:TIGR03759 family integrating conjugative element protein [Gammaproteobacteria bacterium]
MPAPIAHGAAETAGTQEVSTTGQRSAVTATDLERMRLWGLNEEEWRRYQTLLSGPRGGVGRPILDPIMELGITARTDTERRRYAEIAVRLERARVEGELAFDRAYDEAWDRLYPNEPLINMARFQALRAAARKTSVTQGKPSASTEERVLLFTRLDCGECNATVDAVVRRVSAKAGLAADIYFLGTHPSDNAAIQAWAAKRGISPDLVNKRRITLNHDNATLAKLGRNAGRLPQVLRLSNGSVSAISLTELGL